MIVRCVFAAVVAAIAMPALAGVPLNQEPVVFKSGNWSVHRSTDQMTDKVRCTGVYKDNYRIQLAHDQLFIRLKGTPTSYWLRYDDGPSSDTLLPTDIDKQIRIISLKGDAFNSLFSAHRLRWSVLTVLSEMDDGDIDLTGIAEAHANILNGCPDNGTVAPAPAAPASACSAEVKRRLQAKGMSAADIEEVCAAG